MSSPFPHAWSWIRVGLHLLTGLLMALVVLNAVTEPSGPRWPELVSAAAVSGIYAVGTHPWVAGSRRRAAVWLLALGLAWLVLLWLVPEAVFLAFPLYFLAAHLLGDRSAIVVVTLLAVVAVVGFAWHRGFSVGVVIGPSLGAVVALATVLGLRVVERESARRGVLEERERLAREIHDTLAQGFASINLLLGAASSRLEQQQDAETRATAALVERARDVAVANLTEARRFVHALAPSSLGRTALVETLRRTVGEFPRTTFTVDGAPVEVGSEHEVAVLRIAREALSNAARYARASRVAVTLTFNENEVALDVVDDGVGFDDGQRNRGFGLGSMSSRAAELGGRLTIESTPGRGTAVALALPLTPAATGATASEGAS